MTLPFTSRRELLKHATVGLIALPGNTFGRLPWLYADEPTTRDTTAILKQQLEVKTEQPFNAETPLGTLGERWITPLESFYVRSNGTVPALNLRDFTLTVTGLVEQPLTLTVGELLERFPLVKTTATLTCAGNRRIEFATTKKASGLQWVSGAMGNADWSGVRLSDVLKRAGVKPGAKHVWFDGLDQVIEKTETISFGGSIPLDKALADTATAPGALLATQMNGRALLPEHGFPLRAVVPGFIGARSVKWLGQITVSDRPSPNKFVSSSYKIVPNETPAAAQAATPLYEQCLNSMICTPSEGAAISGDRLTVKGFAMAAGHAGRRVKSVEVSADNGQSWQPATFTSPLREFCWGLWSADVALTPQTTSLLVRATDSSGETQPQTMTWNAKGYQFNAWHKVNVKRA